MGPCNVNKIASLLTAASALIAAAIVAVVLGAVLAGSIFTAFGNIVVMGIAAGLFAAALANVSVAMIEASNCLGESCGRDATALYASLGILSFALAGLVTMSLIAVWAASIAYAGIGVAIALAVVAALAGGDLYAASILLSSLTTCRATPSKAVDIQVWVGGFVGLALLVFGGLGAAGTA